MFNKLHTPIFRSGTSLFSATYMYYVSTRKCCYLRTYSTFYRYRVTSWSRRYSKPSDMIDLAWNMIGLMELMNVRVNWSVCPYMQLYFL
jgi:hypothetical protein